MSEDPAAAAFDQLRAEVALLRRAVEGLAAGQPTTPPDYAPSLAKLQKQTSAMGKHLEDLAANPVLAVTPAVIGAQITSVLARAREDARVELTQAQSRFERATGDLSQMIARARMRDDQRRWLLYAFGAGAAFGIVIWLALSGPLVRLLPTKWQLPERMAARTLNLDRWAAGGRLMSRADPVAWGRVVLGDLVVRENRETLEACAAKAERAAKPVRCSIQIRPPP